MHCFRPRVTFSSNILINCPGQQAERIRARRDPQAAPGTPSPTETTREKEIVRIAIVGAGIAGLGSAWLLQKQGHAVTLFEASERLGGHTHTVDVTLDGITAPVDTGFLVFNDRTYPKLVALLDELGVASVASEMSF